MGVLDAEEDDKAESQRHGGYVQVFEIGVHCAHLSALLPGLRLIGVLPICMARFKASAAASDSACSATPPQATANV
jgi:hypothetical protein